MDSVTKPGETANELRSYGGEAGDARVARRRAALVDASLGMLTEPESGAVTVRGICARAGLTPRYFYESFDNIDALASATYDGVIAEIAERAAAAFASGQDPHDKVQAAVEAIVDVIDSDRRKGRLIFSDTLHSPVLAGRRAASLELFAALTSESAAQVGRIARVDETMAAAHFQVGGLGRVLASWTEGRLDLDRDRLVAVCVRMMLPTSAERS
ncbi:putative TetR-family transcriptional regulator [Gordonia spumicola]|uniref:Putative TetR-family transcriptional regulator n=1 Tax=Gordonia spumicola TaxID=589161 RepID=A0A7I9V8L2_9ACTN|nr:TetR/AcrR family transcriptional regulator [Gordonia spumicola]GEE01629.1 putative TetR-family transcriptional regulator [Gordonia spumicola]GEE01783.1 putative TetR-family transcriptional regulator [Gordonia spumicola]GEE01785.1 putative TetR-family transcriptional regulator [Gordonia spumicola]